MKKLTILFTIIFFGLFAMIVVLTYHITILEDETKELKSDINLLNSKLNAKTIQVNSIYFLKVSDTIYCIEVTKLNKKDKSK